MSRRTATPVRRQPPGRTSSPQDASASVALRMARAARVALRNEGIASGGRILDLCCGLGRQAELLAADGYRTVGMDIRRDAAILDRWRGAARRRRGLRFVCGDVRDLPLRGPFAAVLLLYNGLALFHENDDALALLRQARGVIGPRGVLLMDNLCRSIWREIADGRYADGISEDGLWQMIWRPARNVFSLRYGPQVRPGSTRPRRGEMLYRAWSFDEIDLLCRLSGWTLDPAGLRKPLLIARPD